MGWVCVCILWINDSRDDIMDLMCARASSSSTYLAYVMGQYTIRPETETICGQLLTWLYTSKMPAYYAVYCIYFVRRQMNSHDILLMIHVLCACARRSVVSVYVCARCIFSVMQKTSRSTTKEFHRNRFHNTWIETIEFLFHSVYYQMALKNLPKIT